MKYWILADPHLGQVPDPAKAENDVFGRPADFSERILKGLRNIKDGVLVCLGDVCFKNEESWHEQIAKACPNILRWLILGNHDAKSATWYMTHGWHFVGRSFLISIYGHDILFSHKPQKETGEFSLNIHGHFHNTDFKKHEPEIASILTDKHRLIALEYSGFTPVNLKTVVDNPKKFSPDKIL